MSDIVIRVENMSKRYRIGERERYVALRDILTRAAYAPVRLFKPRNAPSPNADHSKGDHSHIWALRDVSFDIRQGQVVGIIGRNGAGKSTLLKILARVTKPTQGIAEVRGRMGTLLEVGTGFHPELTGRENVFLSGAILGMSKSEIHRKFDEIVAFAEVEKFIDTPLKHYSTGMQMRLAFAVAAHLEPEILLVDEVLAVGDAQFQRKCLNKMQSVGEDGRTVLLVSHNMNAIQRLCHSTIWLDKAIIKRGATATVVAQYLRTASSSVTEICWEDPETAPGNDIVRLRSASIKPPKGRSSDRISVHTDFVMEFEYWNLRPGTYLNLSVHVFNEENICLFNTGPACEPVWNGKPFPVGLFRSVCHVPRDLMNDGMHRVQLLVVQNQGIVIYRHDDLLTFEVHEEVEMRDGYLGDWPGALRPKLEWTTELL